MVQKLIILDRDGVINRDLGTYVTHPDEFEFIDGAIAAIARLKRAEHTIAIATNQAGISRGRYNHERLAAIHAKMLSEIRRAGGDIDRIVYCPSYDNDHPWRKPNSGMLAEIMRGFDTTAENTVFIGDAVRDMQAGFALGCQLIMVANASGKADYHDLADNIRRRAYFVADLNAAVAWLLDEENP